MSGASKYVYCRTVNIAITSLPIASNSGNTPKILCSYNRIDNAKLRPPIDDELNDQG